MHTFKLYFWFLKIFLSRIERNKLCVPECQIIAEVLLSNHSLELIEYVFPHSIYSLSLLSPHHSLSRNPIGDDGFSIILDALIKKPDTLKKIG